MTYRRVVATALLICTSAAAEDIAPWAPLDAFPSKLRLVLSQFQEIFCAPTDTEVVRPIFPGAMILGMTWPKKKPNCDAQLDPTEFQVVALVSKDQHGVVEEWYTSRLTGFSRFQIDTGVVFVKGVREDFIWNRDSYSAPHVLVIPASGMWREGGFETLIEMFLPGL